MIVNVFVAFHERGIVLFALLQLNEVFFCLAQRVTRGASTREKEAPMRFHNEKQN